MQDPCVIYVSGPMCRWKMASTDMHRESYVRKEIGFLTSSPKIAAVLEGVCSNFIGEAPWHRHVVLLGGKAAAARVHPPKMVAAVVRALKEELEE